MTGTATHRVVTTEFDYTYAYITDRVTLEQQEEPTVWGPVKEKLSRPNLQTMTALGEAPSDGSGGISIAFVG